jgi:cell division transport system permease protein
MSTWFLHHLHALHSALLRLIHAPFASLFTLINLGIALSLPALMAITLYTVQQLSGTLPQQGAVTVYLHTDASETDRAQLEKQINQLHHLAHQQFISKQTALTQLSQQLTLGNLSEELPTNPLPDAWVLTPTQLDPALTQAWTQQLTSLPMVALVQGNQAWSTRLHALLNLGKQTVVLLGILLGSGVITLSAIVTHLQIMSRKPEIEISRLIGATHSFISRPFLYFGLLEGLLAGITAAAIVYGFVLALAEPVATLAHDYASTFHIWLPAPQIWLAGVAAAGVLGWLGAWLAVWRTLVWAK